MAEKIRDVLKRHNLEAILDWDLHPWDAVTRYLEWGNNWSRGLDHAKACGERAAYFKIRGGRLYLVTQSHHDYKVIAEIEAPQDLIEGSPEPGISPELRKWLKKESV